MAKTRATIREDIIAATLNHVPFDGWSLTSLRRGAEDVGYDAVTVVRVFPEGVADAIECHSKLADARTARALEASDTANMRVRDRVIMAVRLRLEQNAQHREAVRAALGYLAQPQHAPLAMKCLYRTVDSIWYAAGDTATDFNFYTKRALLAAVYSATVLYWLNDKSEGFADTWRFLERRIDDVLRLPRLTAPLKEGFDRLPNPFRFFRALAQDH